MMGKNVVVSFLTRSKIENYEHHAVVALVEAVVGRTGCDHKDATLGRTSSVSKSLFSSVSRIWSLSMMTIVTVLFFDDAVVLFLFFTTSLSLFLRRLRFYLLPSSAGRV